MELSTAKAISMLSLGLGSFISGMAPAFISQEARQRNPLLVSCLLCFGAGVLLSTSLLHMLPEARELLPQYSELMLCAGFFIVYVVDEIVHFFYGTQGHGNHGHEAQTHGTQTYGVQTQGAQGYVTQGYGHSSQSYAIHQQRTYGTGERTGLLSTVEVDGSNKTRCCGDTGNPRMCHVSHTEPCNKSYSGIVGLLVALFVHSLLEGLAIGVQESATQVLLLLAAVASHKFVVGFCLGAELCASGIGRLCTHIICVVIFSGASVLGIGLGAALDVMVVMKDSTAVPILQAIAAGTLLYVTVSEVLPRERARWHERRRSAGIAQFLAVAAGFTLMYLMTRYLDHDAA